ncbi:uncharacterized protein LOC130669039 [Microplitis mediator]|uniref:uncharacterized protein LOC130669039 n=1 Tax=Microplitis mediator TaxID=375433 RepID=UPI00255404C3|nr:uncharacterized protein LOC130669039 [Microplitis mediator]XP_057327688.1 uncharacterized protein LOC130669039 [Microplitis mediator]XP_057327689.1 uncharacterized protein LOC130669039 [Microplitis mediator]
MERVKTSLDSGNAAAMDEDEPVYRERFLKINVRHISDGQLREEGATVKDKDKDKDKDTDKDKLDKNADKELSVGQASRTLEERRRSMLDHHWAVPSKDRCSFSINKEQQDSINSDKLILYSKKLRATFYKNTDIFMCPHLPIVDLKKIKLSPEFSYFFLSKDIMTIKQH